MTRFFYTPTEPTNEPPPKGSPFNEIPDKLDEVWIDELGQGLEEHVRMEFRMAVKARQMHQLDTAMGYLVKVMKEAPTFLPGLVEMGRVNLLDGNLHQATYFFNSVLQAEEANKHALRGLGKVARKRRDWKEAQAYFQAVLDREPEDRATLYEMGQVHLEQGDVAKATGYFEQALPAEKVEMGGA